MPRGKVQSYNQRGFGWIKTDERDQRARVWYHISQWQNDSRVPRPGDNVSFEPAKDDQGRDVATKIVVHSPPEYICNRVDAFDRGTVADPVDVNEGLLRFLRPNPRR